jgi:hypothetical protein
MAPGGGFARPGVPRGKALNSISITGAQGGQDNFLENLKKSLGLGDD